MSPVQNMSIEELKRAKLMNEVSVLEKKLEPSKKDWNYYLNQYQLAVKLVASIAALFILFFTSWSDIGKYLNKGAEASKLKIDNQLVTLVEKLSPPTNIIGRRNAAYLLHEYGDSTIDLLIRNIEWATDNDTIEAVTDSLKLFQNESNTKRDLVWGKILTNTKEIVNSCKESKCEDDKIQQILKNHLNALALTSSKNENNLTTEFKTMEEKINKSKSIDDNTEDIVLGYFCEAKKKVSPAVKPEWALLDCQ